MIVEAITIGAYNIDNLMTSYHELGQQLAESDLSGRAAVGLILHMGLLRLNNGYTDDALEDFEDAYNYAVAMGMKEVLPGIEVILGELHEAEPGPEQTIRACSEVLPSEDCEDLRELDPEDMLGAAFSLLLDHGVDDPEEFLIMRGILEY